MSARDARRNRSTASKAVKRALIKSAAEQVDADAAALRAAIRGRDDFLSIASHELKTPLTTLGLQVEGMLRSARKDPSRINAEWLESKLEMVQRQNLRLTQLVNELLDVSRIHAGRLELCPSEVDLIALLSEVIDRLQPEAASAGCHLALDLSGRPVGRWDKSRLDQIITNLLSNAIKYGQGAPVELKVRGHGSQVVLQVYDHGIGIAPEDQDRIFQRFERLVSAEKYRGMGLGLWIVRQLVERMGGVIRVESTLGRGSCFTVELPLGGASERSPRPGRS